MDLFSQEPPLPARSGLQIEVPLTKDQKAFNALIKKIEAKRTKLAEWEAVIPVFNQKYVSDLLPLQEKERALQIQLAQALDGAFDQKGLSKPERKKLSAMIVELASLVLNEQDDDTAKALYNKHSLSDFDAEKEELQAEERAMFEHVFGVDLGDDVDMSSPEEVLQRFEQLRGTQAAAQEEEAAAARPRKKTAKQLAKEEALAAEESQMSQSIRETYRKLASALHPDREPDPAEKLRKTGLMQRANQAYKNGNLLKLLELQLELEHIDQAHLAGLSADRMRHYLKILKSQLAEIEQEIYHLEEKMSFEFNLSPYQRLQPGAMIPMLRKDVGIFEIHLQRLQQDLEMVTGDLPQLKALLKTVKLARQRREPDFDIFF